MYKQNVVENNLLLCFAIKFICLEQIELNCIHKYLHEKELFCGRWVQGVSSDFEISCL